MGSTGGSVGAGVGRRVGIGVSRRVGRGVGFWVGNGVGRKVLGFAVGADCGACVVDVLLLTGALVITTVSEVTGELVVCCDGADVGVLVDGVNVGVLVTGATVVGANVLGLKLGSLVGASVSNTVGALVARDELCASTGKVPTLVSATNCRISIRCSMSKSRDAS